MTAPRVIVLAGLGINCERETAVALRLAGADPDIVHISRILCGDVSIPGAEAVVFPGGFSFGDELGAGQALANRIRHRQTPSGETLLAELRTLLGRGGRILGICNGFQVLVKLGLLPNFAGDYVQEVTLTENRSGRYEDRWCRLHASPHGPAPFASLGLLELPVRHREGRLVFRDDAVRHEVAERGLNFLTYVDASGTPTQEYPANPNGADLACAGLTDTTGQVIGLMPHGEAYVSPYTHYDWPRRRREGTDTAREPDGLRLFRAFVRSMTER